MCRHGTNDGDQGSRQYLAAGEPDVRMRKEAAEAAPVLVWTPDRDEPAESTASILDARLDRRLSELDRGAFQAQACRQAIRARHDEICRFQISGDLRGLVRRKHRLKDKIRPAIQKTRHRIDFRLSEIRLAGIYQGRELFPLDDLRIICADMADSGNVERERDRCTKAARATDVDPSVRESGSAGDTVTSRMLEE